MTDLTRMFARHQAMLAEMAEMQLSFVERLAARLGAAKTPAEVLALARQYEDASRSVRQTVVLMARLEQEQRKARPAAEAGAPAKRPRPDWPARPAGRLLHDWRSAG
jgi:hypothetical protein